MDAAGQTRSDDVQDCKRRTRPAAQTVMRSVRETLLALLANRAAGATICPSEVARAIAPAGEWRDAMPLVHAAVDRLLAEQAVHLSWKGQPMADRAGPYRIALR
ncbi:DUF3253 domain-containing protein [Altererythrobacter xixiisoli]|uniref:DUF3253 domain-containing protein n=1 Tax=Croceibacterium xixiisoli TaxID=1476466 RepID=A0A6I4U2Y1_9SPHN|nr:DUF3253 domain-containing protein [Croceibacterium xixiisoli]MXP00924.1 DUF3253 domain-containing protein [Croceibacterium xixiisoli]